MLASLISVPCHRLYESYTGVLCDMDGLDNLEASLIDGVTLEPGAC